MFETNFFGQNKIWDTVPENPMATGLAYSKSFI